MNKKLLIIPIAYIAMECLFQRQLMNTLMNLDSHHLERMEYMSRLLMACSATILVSYLTRWKIVWMSVAISVFMLSANLFDVVNKSLTPEERQVITWNFLANQQDGTLQNKEKMANILRMALPSHENSHSQALKSKVMDETHMERMFTKMQKQRELIKTKFVSSARSAQFREMFRQSLAEPGAFERLLKNPRMSGVYEEMNDRIAKEMKVTFDYSTQPFPKNINLATTDFDDFRLQFQQWMTKVAIAKYGEFNEREVLQAAIMIPIGFVASSVGIILNLIMFAVSAIRMVTQHDLQEGRRETMLSAVMLVSIAVLGYYLFVPLTVLVTSITLM